MNKKFIDYSDLNDRLFKAVWNGEGMVSEYEFRLFDEVTDDDYESTYSIAEHINEILLMDVGDSIYFLGCRDDEKSKGIIIRIE